jgi:uncharacterized protein involved in exopolysaccharide biosynthesis
MAAGVAGMKSSGDMYVAFLKGSTVRDQLIEKYHLQERYDEKTLVETRKKLDKHIKILTEKSSGLIGIEVEDKDPAFAAELANAHVNALSELMGRLALSEARQRRIYFEREVDKVARKAFRDIRIQEAVLGSLLKQLEMARLDEAKEAPLLQQVDIARTPDKRSSPRRGLMIAFAGILGLAVGMTVGFFRRSFKNMSVDPRTSIRFDRMKSTWA